MIKTIKNTIHDAFNLRMDIATPEVIFENIDAGAKVKGTNMCILILAILIASIGLNMNSTAVIIGAMLISPLMGGIMAIGYGIAVNDLNYSKKAVIGLIFQVIICILTSTIYFSLSPISSAHSEILARTSPSVWDVLIAICGGLAGIIGMTRKEKSNVIPGVAIATALMPPLCTAGYGLATRHLNYFLGAIYLFFINGFFICLSTIFILKVISIPSKKIIDAKEKHKLYVKLIIIAIITVIPSVFLAYQLIGDSVESNNIKEFMEKELNYEDTQIVHMYFDKEKKTIQFAFVGKTLDEKEIKRLDKVLPKYGLADLHLKISQPNMEGIITSEDLKNYMANSKMDDSQVTLALKDNEIAGLQKQLKKYEKYDFDLKEISQDLKILYPSIEKVSLGIQQGQDVNGKDTFETLLVELYTNDELSEKDQKTLIRWFESKTSEEDVTLVIKKVDGQSYK